MKIREGFVSNSSSSSFIIAYNDEINLHDSLINHLTNLGYGDRSRLLQEHLISRAYDIYNINDIDNWNERNFEDFLEDVLYLLRSVIESNDLDKYDDFYYPFDNVNKLNMKNELKSLLKSNNISTILYGTMEDCSINLLDLELVNEKIIIIDKDIKVYNDPRR